MDKHEGTTAPHSNLKQAHETWKQSAQIRDDPLLGCLEILCSIYERAFNRTTLVTGLPLLNNRLTPDLFIRAAHRATLSARTIQKDLHDLSPFTLPCILLIEGNKACLLLSIKDETAEVIFPEMGHGATVMHLNDLQSIYMGGVIFCRPYHQTHLNDDHVGVESPPRSWFWGTLFHFWPTYAQVAIAAILINVFSLASPLFVMNVYDRVVPHNGFETLWVLACGVGLVFLFDFILRLVRGHFVDNAGKNIDILLGSRIFEHILGLKMSHKPTSAGGFANQLREFETLREFFSSLSLVALIDLPFVLLFISIVAYIGGPIAFVPILAIPLMVGGTLLFQIPLRAHIRKTCAEAGQKHGLLIEAINGLETIKSLGVEGRIQKNWERFVQKSASSSNAVRFVAATATHFSALIQQLSYAGVIITGVYLIAAGELTLGGLIACSILSGRALAPMGQFVGHLSRLNQASSALKGLNAIMALETERAHGLNSQSLKDFQGDVEFRNVSFTYPGQKIPALRDVSFKIKPGEKVALLGRVGSGKTTLQKLLLGLFEPTSGSLLLDGVDSRQIEPAEIRSQMGYIQQDVFLFNGTVRENIAMGIDHLDEETLIRIGDISGVNEIVKHAPQGYDLPIGEGGRLLSGGQRQCIAVARALVRQARLLLLDEPTAMMDNTAEAKLITQLKQHAQNKTVIVVTHRMALLSLVDRIIVVDEGKIVADGKRDDVIKALTGMQMRSGSPTQDKTSPTNNGPRAEPVFPSRQEGNLSGEGGSS